MNIQYVNKQYIVTVDDVDVEKVKAEAAYTGKGYRLAGWLVARHYAPFVDSQKFRAVKHALLSACGIRGARKRAARAKEAKQLMLMLK